MKSKSAWHISGGLTVADNSDAEEYVAGKRHGIQETAVHRSYPCPTCGLYFANRTALRQHHSKIQKASLVPTEKNGNVKKKQGGYSRAVDGMHLQ